ncbi:hypothetical protein ACI68E_000138 [Malassezia pachydermatis]
MGLLSSLTSHIQEPDSGVPADFFTFQTCFASLSLHMTDRIRFIGFSPEALATVRQVVQQTWQPGIQNERPYGGSHEIKLYGNPWRGIMGEAISSRRLMRNILAALYSQGWILTISTDISKKVTDKDTLIFRHQTPSPPPCEWISIAFSNADLIRFISAPRELVDDVAKDLGPILSRPTPLQHSEGVLELKLSGSPWYAEGRATMSARQAILQLVMTLERHGFSVYASIDQKETGRHGHESTGSSETDTWHLCRTVGWQPGLPIFHR